MKRPVVLDFETIPLASSLTAPYPEGKRSAPSNYKDPIKIAQWIERDRASWADGLVKTASVNPRLGRLLCSGWGYAKDDIHVDYAVTDADEKALIRSAWQRLADNDGRVAGWNSRGFDLRFLVIRSLINGVEPTLPPAIIADWFKKYGSIYHFDAKLALMDGDAMSQEGVNEWAAALGLPGKTDGMSGRDVWPLFQRGEHERITQYQRGDIVSEMAIVDKIAPFFLSPFDGRKHMALVAAHAESRKDFAVLAEVLHDTPRVSAATGPAATTAPVPIEPVVLGAP